MSRTTLARATALLLAIGVAGCGSDSATGTSQTDLAGALKELSLTNITAIPIAVGGAPLPAQLLFVPSSCSYAGASQLFTCPGRTINGVNFTQSYGLYDASGAAQQSYNQGTTAAVRAITTAKGNLSDATLGSFLIDESQDMTLSGLLTGTHIVNGTIKSIMSTVPAGGLSVNMTMTFANLVLPTDTSVPGATPTSGSITIDDVASFAGSSSSHTVSVLTFNGTSTITLVSTTDGTTVTCTLNVATGGSSCH